MRTASACRLGPGDRSTGFRLGTGDRFVRGCRPGTGDWELDRGQAAGVPGDIWAGKGQVTRRVWQGRVIRTAPAAPDLRPRWGQGGGLRPDRAGIGTAHGGGEVLAGCWGDAYDASIRTTIDSHDLILRGLRESALASALVFAAVASGGAALAAPGGEGVDLRGGLEFHRAWVEAPVEIPAREAPVLGTNDFTLALWVQSDEDGDQLSGDLVSRYDPTERRGFHLTLKSNPGVTSNQANWRHLQFGIDADRGWEWEDCGRPGNALFAFALAVHDDALYAGTCEPGEGESGRVYRHGGGDRWLDCGALDGANAVTAFAVHRGKLHAATGRYRVAGSSLPESRNTTLGGRVFVRESDRSWTSCGQLPDTGAVGGLVVFRGRLYASSLYRPAGFFRYEEGTHWTSLPVPQVVDPASAAPVPQRVEALTVHEGFLYASSYDDGRVWRFDGEAWSDCGRLGQNTQTYAFVQYRGRLHVGTWPSGRVYRWEGAGRWADAGRLGEELEVMGMLVHNGRFLAGSLPLAGIYEYQGGDSWRPLRRLDPTQDVKYRRAWTMAEHRGRVYCSTLPSGRIHAFSVGGQAGWGHTLSSAWHHVIAAKSATALALYVDGRRVAETSLPDAGSYALDSEAPLRLGFGMNGPFPGRLSDVRLYRRTLNGGETEALVAAGAGSGPVPR
jgi:hypothetical protein